MDEKTAIKTTAIQEAMAEKRASLRESIYHLEKEAEKKVLQTLDEVQHKILAASDEVTRKVTRPIHMVEEKINMVPQALQSKPAKTLLIVASIGVTLGFLLGRRGRHRHHMTRALLATAEPRRHVREKDTRSDERKFSPARGFFSSVASEAAHQILMNSLTSFLRRRN